MSGHSKFHNIKNIKQKADAKRSQIFTKIGREISVAVKSGGADPNTNSKLADIIVKARTNNMPNDNISRSIKKASGEVNSINYSEIIYEGYGPNGVAFVVECLTDNKNRTAGDVRHLFDKHGGSLGVSGSVLFMFERRGVIVIERTEGVTEDDIMNIAIESGAEDVVNEEDAFVVYTELSQLSSVRQAYENAKYNVVSSEIEFIPSNYVTVSDDVRASLEKLIDKLEDLDDVQNVFHNAEI